MKKIYLALLVCAFPFFISAQNAYIPNRGSANVSVINTSTNTVIATIPVGGSPVGVAVSPDGSRVIVTNQDSNTISVISTTTNAVIATIPVGNSPGSAAFSPSGTIAYIGNISSSTVSVVDLTSNTVTATITGVDGSRKGIAVHPDGSRIYVSGSGGSDAISVVNTATNSVIATIPVGTRPEPIVISQDGSKVYTANQDDETVSVILTATNTVEATIPLGAGTIDPERGIDINAAGTRVFVTNENSDNTTIIDATTNTVIGTFPTGNFPQGVTIHPDGDRLYIANSDDNAVAVFDLATNTVTATIPVGNGPIAFGRFIVAGSPPPSPAIPAMSDWGLIILALLMLCLATAVLLRRQSALAVAGRGTTSISQGGGSTFDKSRYFKILAAVSVGVLALLVAATGLWNYELTTADVPGSLIATPVLAYLIYLLSRR